jgi:hypothetical protein
MSDDRHAHVDLYWIPLGAGGHSVRFNGRVYEAITAALARRERRDLFHAALLAGLDGETYAIELAPSWSGDEASRGVVATGPVGTRLLGRFRLFRYELRGWRGGSIPDLDHAVGAPLRVTADPKAVRRILAALEVMPTPVWGRDPANVGDMWNSNSAVAWLLASGGVAVDSLGPPANGRAPGWDAGIALARGATGARGRKGSPPKRAARRSTRATRSERHAPLPGDELVPQPLWQATRAITIRAPSSAVWPWLVQMGFPTERGGWYTPHWVDRLAFGIRARSAETIVPELQRLSVGDVIPDSERGNSFFEVVALDPERALVLRSRTHPLPAYRDVDFTWAFVLQDAGGGRTRLLVRARVTYTAVWPSLLVRALMLVGFGLGDLVQAGGMLRGIRDRAERRPAVSATRCGELRPQVP